MCLPLFVLGSIGCTCGDTLTLCMLVYVADVVSYTPTYTYMDGIRPRHAGRMCDDESQTPEGQAAMERANREYEGYLHVTASGRKTISSMLKPRSSTAHSCPGFSDKSASN